MRTEQKQKLALRRRWRIRQKISGTKDRPRMSVCFTNKNIHVQFIDDAAGVTLAAAWISHGPILVSAYLAIPAGTP